MAEGISVTGNKKLKTLQNKINIQQSQEQLYGQFDSAIDGQSHSSGCRFDTCSCCGLHAGEKDDEALTVSYSTAGGVHRLCGDDWRTSSA